MSVPVPPSVVLPPYRHLARGVQSIHRTNAPAKIGDEYAHISLWVFPSLDIIP